MRSALDKYRIAELSLLVYIAYRLATISDKLAYLCEMAFHMRNPGEAERLRAIGKL